MMSPAFIFSVRSAVTATTSAHLSPRSDPIATTHEAVLLPHSICDFAQRSRLDSLDAARHHLDAVDDRDFSSLAAPDAPPPDASFCSIARSFFSSSFSR